MSNYTAKPLVNFSDTDARGLSMRGEDGLQWPVSLEQLQAWGAKEGAECSWHTDGSSLCWFVIDGRWVAKGERGADGAYTWTPQCTCLDDEDSGGNRFRDWDEDCPVHGRAALNAGTAQER